MSIGSNYDLKFEGQAYGFKWRIWADIKHKHPLTEEILDIKVGRVEGPYCLNDYREMKVYRTFFGRYRYKCPKCGYKRILLKNTWSLEYDIKDDIEAKYRNKTNIVS
jgi:transposase-like protein